MSLLPSRPDTSSADAEPRVIGVDSDDADDVISALSSGTARELLAELHEEPAPPSELADRVDTSLQNAQYHLEKLQSAGAVSVVDTAYSAKGREMDVYAPADKPLVIFAGDEDGTTGLKAALSRLLGGVGLLGIGSLAVQRLYGDGGTAGDTNGVSTGAGTPTPDGTAGSQSGGVIEMYPVTEGPTTAEVTSETINESAVTFGANGTYTYTGNVTDVVANETLVNATDSGSLYFVDRNGTKYVLDVANATTPNMTDTASTGVDTTATTIAQETTAQASDTAGVAAGVEPGLLFFAGGLAILLLWLFVWYAR